MRIWLLKSTLSVSYAWSIALILGVIFNFDYAFSRAAGGQFESFPMHIRATYLLNLALILFGLYSWFRKIKGMKVKPYWIISFFFYINCLSVILQLISRSPNERWNAIPAMVIAYSFYLARNEIK